MVLGATMPTLWVQPSFHDWIWFIVVGLSGSFGQFCYNQAFRYGEASMVAPLDYLSIVWATLMGFVVFGDIPSWLVLGGAASSSPAASISRGARPCWPRAPASGRMSRLVKAGHIRRSFPLRGLVYMGLGVFCMSVVDAASKQLVGGYSLAQVMFFTRIMGPFFAIALAMSQGGLLTLSTGRMGWHLLRGIVSAATAVTFVASLRLLPLADAVAITFVSPLLMSALSVPMLRERVGPRRWAAILVGLIGVVVVLQPSGAGFGLGAMLALFAALTYALSLNMSRLMSDTETSQSILFWFSTYMLLGSGLLMLFDWQTPGLFDCLLFAVLAVAASLGQFCVIQALRYGQVSLLAPLEYSALIWATSFGFIFLGGIPHPHRAPGRRDHHPQQPLCRATRGAWPPAARGLTAKDRLRIFPAHDRERRSRRRRRRRRRARGARARWRRPGARSSCSSGERSAARPARATAR